MTNVLKALRKFAPVGDVLTRERLENMKPGIFASGTGLIEHPWFNDAEVNLEKDGRSCKVHWVAVKGWGEDWAIFHSLDANLEPADYLDGVLHLLASNERIAAVGAKVHREEDVVKFISCDKEVLKRYRH